MDELSISERLDRIEFAVHRTEISVEFAIAYLKEVAARMGFSERLAELDRDRCQLLERYRRDTVPAPSPEEPTAVGHAE